MNTEIILYHGAENPIEIPEYNRGKPYNDYGVGFYCTEHIELAKEWACTDEHGGFASKYKLNISDLSILDLNGEEYSILHWLSVLLRHRTIAIPNETANAIKEYIINTFPVDIGQWDVIKGYRADDSYFTYAKDFLQNTISLRRLSEAMRLGNLGNQYVLKSQKAFDNITYLGCEVAEKNKYFALRNRRDKAARESYLQNKAGNMFSPEDLYAVDIVRMGMKPDDIRLRQNLFK